MHVRNKMLSQLLYCPCLKENISAMALNQSSVSVFLAHYIKFSHAFSAGHHFFDSIELVGNLDCDLSQRASSVLCPCVITLSNRSVSDLK